MPIIKSAKKAMRVAERRQAENQERRRTYKYALKQASEQKTTETLSRAQRELMKAAKTGVIHKNKAARLISRLSHKVTKTS